MYNYRSMRYGITMIKSMKRSLAKGTAWFILVAGAFLFVAHATANVAPVDKGPGFTESLIASSGCVKATPGVLPSGAVVTLRGHVVAQYTTNPALVGQALDKAIKGKSNRVEIVHQFCK